MARLGLVFLSLYFLHRNTYDRENYIKMAHSRKNLRQQTYTEKKPIQTTKETLPTNERDEIVRNHLRLYLQLYASNRKLGSLFAFTYSLSPLLSFLCSSFQLPVRAMLVHRIRRAFATHASTFYIYMHSNTVSRWLFLSYYVRDDIFALACRF